MTRTYAVKRLLEHGPLTFGELVEITGWSPAQVSTTIDALGRTGLIAVRGQRMKFVYALSLD